MKKFYTGIVRRQKRIVIIFLAFFTVCLFLKNMVAVNYDMNDYLPDSSKSTVALNIMQKEFDGGIPNARVMVYDVTIPEALEYKEKLETVPGVTSVTWLDDVASLSVSLSALDEKVVETYYRNNTALFTVTIEEDSRITAVAAIRDIIGDSNAMTGSAVSTAVATQSTVSEIRKIAVIAILIIIFVLVITTTSWFEPVVVLIGLGLAVVINGGTNIIFGEISFVTNAAGSILQIAVSLDYSVFLLHRFEECRKEKADVKDAMVDALCKSTTSILSSGLTTVIGFLALVLMQFKIGPDLGFALAKGIAISLITVFVFMPSFILLTYKVLDKTSHNAILPEFYKFGKVVQKIAVPMVCIFAIIIIPAYLAFNANHFYYGSSHIFGQETQLGADTAAIEDVFGKSDTYVLLVPQGDTATETKLSEELHNLTPVTSIISYVDMAGAEIPMEYLDEQTLSMLIAVWYCRWLFPMKVRKRFAWWNRYAVSQKSIIPVPII